MRVSSVTDTQIQQGKSFSRGSRGSCHRQPSQLWPNSASFQEISQERSKDQDDGRARETMTGQKQQTGTTWAIVKYMECVQERSESLQECNCTLMTVLMTDLVTPRSVWPTFGRSRACSSANIYSTPRLMMLTRGADSGRSLTDS
jgi:hypothetical protein